MTEDLDSTNEDVTMLLGAAKRGCRRSANDLFKKFENYLLAISNSELDYRLRSKYGSSDVVQRAYAQAAAALNEFRGTNSREFRAWLRKILINEIHQIRRAMGRANRDASRERNLDGDSVNAGFKNELVDGELTPQSELLRSEQIERVRAAVEKLPELDQEVIKLRNWERWTFPAIAKQLNKQEEAVKKIWQRAIVKLDRLMDTNERSE